MSESYNYKRTKNKFIDNLIKEIIPPQNNIQATFKESFLPRDLSDTLVFNTISYKRAGNSGGDVGMTVRSWLQSAINEKVLEDDRFKKIVVIVGDDTPLNDKRAVNAEGMKNILYDLKLEDYPIEIYLYNKSTQKSLLQGIENIINHRGEGMTQRQRAILKNVCLNGGYLPNRLRGMLAAYSETIMMQSDDDAVWIEKFVQIDSDFLKKRELSRENNGWVYAQLKDINENTGNIKQQRLLRPYLRMIGRTARELIEIDGIPAFSETQRSTKNKALGQHLDTHDPQGFILSHNGIAMPKEHLDTKVSAVFGNASGVPDINARYPAWDSINGTQNDYSFGAFPSGAARPFTVSKMNHPSPFAIMIDSTNPQIANVGWMGIDTTFSNNGEIFKATKDRLRCEDYLLSLLEGVVFAESGVRITHTKSPDGDRPGVLYDWASEEFSDIWVDEIKDLLNQKDNGGFEINDSRENLMKKTISRQNTKIVFEEAKKMYTAIMSQLKINKLNHIHKKRLIEFKQYFENTSTFGFRRGYYDYECFHQKLQKAFQEQFVYFKDFLIVQEKLLRTALDLRKKGKMPAYKLHIEKFNS